MRDRHPPDKTNNHYNTTVVPNAVLGFSKLVFLHFQTSGSNIVATNRRMVLLVDGYNDPQRAKTAYSILRYRAEEVVAVLDRDWAGKTAGEAYGVGGDVPIVEKLEDVQNARSLVIGIAPPGGKIPPQWRPIVLDAIARGWNIVSGLHDFLRDDPEFVAAAEKAGVELIDVRDNRERDVATWEGIRDDCLRIHTVGNDCGVGKMVTAIELTEGLKRAGIDAKFVATGQTGIMIEGDGCPIDRVISDFVPGAAENLVRANQHHEVIVVEGQGSLFHPRYSCVTLGLLHGIRPHGLILCWEAGRTHVGGMPQV
ncbi:MAG: DUF1611 domain-containing protein, partial [Planctomycetota bacterium]